ncbi:MAG TPA: hypothetical protein VE422_43665 [Terriglobia bacterium]|nr:hypothetical protein [Terriglobia bacterium]
MSWKYLTTYLNDHLSGSVGAMEIMEHLEEQFSDLRPQLARLRADIETDRQELKTLMHRLGIPQRRLRKVGGWIAEKLTEIKLTADDPAGGALRQLEGLEALALGIDGRLALWWALNAASDVAPELRGVDYERLVQRALDQRNYVEMLRRHAARTALSLEPSGTARRAA